jgi:hypothetical protein
MGWATFWAIFSQAHLVAVTARRDFFFARKSRSRQFATTVVSTYAREIKMIRSRTPDSAKWHDTLSAALVNFFENLQTLEMCYFSVSFDDSFTQHTLATSFGALLNYCHE